MSTNEPLIPREWPPLGSPVSIGGMSLSELSRKTGISVSYLSRVFRGEKMPATATLSQLAVVLNVTMDRLHAELIDAKHRRADAEDEAAAAAGTPEPAGAGA